MTSVELQGLVRAFGSTTTAVDDVSVSIADGEFFTLVGPSGCGKTTTLRLIAGFETPDRGEIVFGDRSVSGVPPEDRDVGIVFQSYALFPHMTVRENVAYGLRFREPPGGASTEERVSELLSLVDLAGAGDREPAALSGGQQQRVALARALAPGPSVLLLDEPMSALDARLRDRLRGTIKEIQRELDITTVYVTHDQAEALSISDRVAVMRDGAVVQVGTPEAVYREPSSRFVAEFVGENNVVSGTAVPLETGGSSVSVNGVTFELSECVTGDVAVGLRPEALSFGSGGVGFDVTVERTAFRGDTYTVYCDWAGTELLVTTPDPPDRGPATVSVASGGIDVLPE
ncbi:ABC transporter ATP-binding protein [Halobacterium salinarum]|uniref:ABC transporter ATP-binding protein n=1 Tax=Halobacterium salinarum TaxID=2242 RepID=UPI001F41742A|nr:ABC transporter ATP-binding protein [Halobacterium salinarum]MCF2239658.1 ABC transporter ATP-binding protein [Halobacterium salinarum]